MQSELEDNLVLDKELQDLTGNEKGRFQSGTINYGRNWDDVSITESGVENKIDSLEISMSLSIIKVVDIGKIIKIPHVIQDQAFPLYEPQGRLRPSLMTFYYFEISSIMHVHPLDKWHKLKKTKQKSF